MKLSEYPLKACWNQEKKLYEPEKISDFLMEEIVFEGMKAIREKSQYGIVFGTSRKIEMIERVKKAVELYQEGYLKSIIFSGGKNGITSVKNNPTPINIDTSEMDISEIINDGKSEAQRMKELAIQLGVWENDIIIDEQANNTIENVKNLTELLSKEKNITLISSSYHLKRCLAICLKYLSNSIKYILCEAKTGYFEKENYRNTKLGMQLINFEAYHLVRLARENVIEDIDIKKRKKDIK